MNSRRAQTIDVAADIVRLAGPAAVTSVAVAGRLGITQSAVYRHVRDVGELRSAAIRRVVQRLDQELSSVAAESVGAFASQADFEQFLQRLTAAMGGHATAFELVDRWRFDDGELGSGIRSTLAHGRDGIAAILGELRTALSPDTPPLSPRQRSVLAGHAQLIQDDVLGVARLLRQPGWPSTATPPPTSWRPAAPAWQALTASLDG